jgi:2-hydroxychromene-2-carboxylate isomerase
MSDQSDHANAIRLLKALIARGANFKEPIADAYIAQIALEIGLGGDELNSALAYAGSQKWTEDSKMTGRTSLTRAGEGAAESG